MYYDQFVLSDQFARDRHNAILREVEQIRLANQLAAQSPSLPRRAVQHLVVVLLNALPR